MRDGNASQGVASGPRRYVDAARLALVAVAILLGAAIAFESRLFDSSQTIEQVVGVAAIGSGVVVGLRLRQMPPVRLALGAGAHQAQEQEQLIASRVGTALAVDAGVAFVASILAIWVGTRLGSPLRGVVDYGIFWLLFCGVGVAFTVISILGVGLIRQGRRGFGGPIAVGLGAWLLLFSPTSAALVLAVDSGFGGRLSILRAVQTVVTGEPAEDVRNPVAQQVARVLLAANVVVVAGSAVATVARRRR